MKYTLIHSFINSLQFLLWVVCKGTQFHSISCDETSVILCLISAELFGRRFFGMLSIILIISWNVLDAYLCSVEIEIEISFVLKVV